MQEGRQQDLASAGGATLGVGSMSPGTQVGGGTSGLGEQGLTQTTAGNFWSWGPEQNRWKKSGMGRDWITLECGYGRHGAGEGDGTALPVVYLMLEISFESTRGLLLLCHCCYLLSVSTSVVCKSREGKDFHLFGSPVCPRSLKHSLKAQFIDLLGFLNYF